MTGTKSTDLAAGTRLPEHAVVYDSLDCFFFSAAVWLGHRIHFDKRFATEEEGHRDVVVQGPLQGIDLVAYVEGMTGGRVEEISYTHRAAVYVGDTLTFAGTVESIEDATAVVSVVASLLDGSAATEAELRVRLG